ncbi:endo-1,4-beta-xylanase [Leeuwenhoekiella sp. MAR_2009_132]|uniref:endo-1,4-beta-xylanase n=1 Tax=Leeuwenhoekiella sp. MAR_2009_132 TaxID=1392489 RepID=UPI00048C202F|nr:endo-1,4-beta-xylanase [Leeuwenhoekiella sp. MAR_2009_132]
MKNFKLIPVFLIFVGLMSSCEDTIMDWEEVPEENQVTTAELPLELAEKISRYEPLKTYTDVVLGVGIVMDLYVNDAAYRALVNENYDDATVGYAMKHGAMVNNQGQINFGPVDNFIALTNQAGLDVYGHTLVWHANQNANYLNSLIAPTIIPGTSGGNILDLSTLKDGSLTGWGKNGTVTVAADEGLAAGSQAVKFEAATPANYYDLQFRSPLNTGIIAGHTYEISFYVRSDNSGNGKITFRGLDNNYPYKDWYGSGASDNFATTSEWKQVKFTVSDFKTEGGQLQPFGIDFNFGYESNVNYYVDVNTLSLVDLDAETEVVNLITNSDFENATLNPWSGYGNGSSRSVSAQGAGYSSDYAMVLTNPVVANSYSAQQVFEFPTALESGVAHTISFYIKSDVAASLEVELQSPDYSADYSGAINTTTNWTQVVRTLTPSKTDRKKFIFDFGASAATFYIDDIVLTTGEVAAGSETIIIEKTDEEKAELIGAAMEDWMSQMLTHYKSDVHAWDVVNEPMKEGGSLRDGNVTDPANDDFYWVKYLGKDYAVTAFKLARQYGNPDDVLFINDYNLESSLAKLDGLIEYTNYIESKGAEVDGIGTQMHISLNTSRDNIVQMFQKLAASGKLIKVSELDVRLGTASPTMQQLLDQSAMYQFVVDSFREIIPASQQYGITLWNLSDKANEHEFWLPEESPNVFDTNFGRKPAYKGVADGLAGRDVSEDFSGELVD